MIIDCIGCLHGHYPELKGGDLLIITGDLTAKHSKIEFEDFFSWIQNQQYKKIVFISGNHDDWMEKNQQKWICKTDCQDIIYLCDSGTEFEGLKIWGTPWSHRFKGINPKCCAFTYDEELWFYDEKLMQIPKYIDILITHSPPYGILDGIPQEDGSLFHVGSKALYNWLKYVERPRLHVFSHIHEGYGQEEHFPTYNDKMMISVNCSVMNGKYKPINKPTRIIL